MNHADWHHNAIVVNALIGVRRLPKKNPLSDFNFQNGFHENGIIEQNRFLFFVFIPLFKLKYMPSVPTSIWIIAVG